VVSKDPDDRSVRERVRGLVNEMAPRPASEPRSAAHLELDLDYDSLGKMELAAALEQEFGLPPIGEADASGVESVGDIEDLVVGLLAQDRG
jgi:acyl carrier protein